jgi:hypothetical protein
MHYPCLGEILHLLCKAYQGSEFLGLGEFRVRLSRWSWEYTVPDQETGPCAYTILKQECAEDFLFNQVFRPQSKTEEGAPDRIGIFAVDHPASGRNRAVTIIGSVSTAGEDRHILTYFDFEWR